MRDHPHERSTETTLMRDPERPPSLETIRFTYLEASRPVRNKKNLTHILLSLSERRSFSIWISVLRSWEVSWLWNSFSRPFCSRPSRFLTVARSCATWLCRHSLSWRRSSTSDCSCGAKNQPHQSAGRLSRLRQAGSTSKTFSPVPPPEAAGAHSTLPALHQGQETGPHSHLFRLQRPLEQALLLLFYIKDGATHKNVLTSSVSKGHWSWLYCSCSTSRMGPHTKMFSPVLPPEAAGPGSTLPALRQGWGPRSRLFLLRRPLDPVLLFLLYIKDQATQDVLTCSISGGGWSRFYSSCPTSRMGPHTIRRSHPFRL